MKQKHNGYLDGTLTMTHEVLMAFAKAHFDYLKLSGQWGAKSPDDEKIVAMAAEINNLRGQLKLNPKLSATENDNERKDDDGENKNDKKMKNKKYQKKDDEWKKVPPKDGDPKERQVGRFTFQWCEHHMAWTVHKPQDCTLNPKHKDYKGDKGKKNDNRANSAIVASSATVPSATTTLNNRYAALLATFAAMNEEE